MILKIKIYDFRLNIETRFSLKLTFINLSQRAATTQKVRAAPPPSRHPSKGPPRPATMRDGASTWGAPRQHRQPQSVGWSCEKVAISSETKCLPRSTRPVWQRTNHRVAVACEAIPSSGESADEDALRRPHEPGRPRGPSRGTGVLAEVTG